MKNQLSGKTAIITGADRGFGRAIALRLAAEGAKVTVSSRSQNQLDETVDKIRTAGGDAMAVTGDVTNREDVTRVVQTTEQQSMIRYDSTNGKEDT